MKTNFREFLKESFSDEEIRLIDVEAQAEAKAILRAQELATQFITSRLPALRPRLEKEFTYRRDDI